MAYEVVSGLAPPLKRRDKNAMALGYLKLNQMHQMADQKADCRLFSWGFGVIPVLG